MKLVIVRHGDPDYTIDSLTPKGHTEAKLLAEKMKKMNVKEFYVSPLGRAKDTAHYTLEAMNRTAIELPWLREFSPLINRPDVADKRKISWDWLPQDWTMDERFYQYDHWFENEIMQEAHVKEEYDMIVENFDKLLAKHGYERNGHIYDAVSPNTDTIVLFCHFGLGCVLMSHLMSVSPMVLWHSTCVAPTGVSFFYTEERRPGIASFRMGEMGSTEHLYVAGEEPAFAARFCEVYTDLDNRHD